MHSANEFDKLHANHFAIQIQRNIEQMGLHHALGELAKSGIDTYRGSGRVSLTLMGNHAGIDPVSGHQSLQALSQVSCRITQFSAPLRAASDFAPNRVVATQQSRSLSHFTAGDMTANHGGRNPLALFLTHVGDHFHPKTPVFSFVSQRVDSSFAAMPISEIPPDQHHRCGETLREDYFRKFFVAERRELVIKGQHHHAGNTRLG